MANVYKNQSSGAGGGGVGKEGTGRRPWASFFALISFFSLFFFCDEGYEKENMHFAIYSII